MRLAIVVVTAVLIAYGSLYPFDFAIPTAFAAKWSALLARRNLWNTTEDVLGNVALFVALGAVALLATPVPRRTARGVIAIIVGCIGFAFVLQVAQIYVPSRVASLADVFWNGVGTVTGVAGAAVLERLVSLKPPHLRRDSWVVLAIIGPWVIAEFAPFVLSLDLSSMKESLEPLLFAPRFNSLSALYYCINALVLGRLLDVLVGAERSRQALAALVLAAIAAKVVVVAQVLPLHFALGLMAGLCVHALIPEATRRRGDLALVAVFVIAYALRAISPFQFRVTPAPIRWLPFEASLEGGMLSNVRSLSANVFAFGAMLWLVLKARGKVFGSAVGLALLLALLEYAQTWVRGRVGDITTPLLALAWGAFLYWTLSPHRRVDKPASTIAAAPASER